MAEFEGKIAILSGLGCRIIASTGRLDEVDYLRSLSGLYVANSDVSVEQPMQLLYGGVPGR